mmetsp:Transcript_16402/g.35945  ORF Transcript_16402/g.35945 Transcript_16402/m.35945 type:complete len:98 (-) Transcript_16402:409-702(-)
MEATLREEARSPKENDNDGHDLGFASLMLSFRERKRQRKSSQETMQNQQEAQEKFNREGAKCTPDDRVPWIKRVLSMDEIDDDDHEEQDSGILEIPT